ncbi:hypothetical protein PVK06_024996 [Gossypium arboreum]|uniref:Uncharacterized protein n=1 Tax=Gossypium arboreum TaxID=29729 RepID=A0ABR0PFU7_GOSAR|nr:hypothetical protein PVK06_024996 [Gossypium arboreum]
MSSMCITFLMLLAAVAVLMSWQVGARGLAETTTKNNRGGYDPNYGGPGPGGYGEAPNYPSCRPSGC